MKKLVGFAFLLQFIAALAYGQEEITKTIPGEKQGLKPANILMLDNDFVHHIAIAEKSTHQLHLYRNKNGHPEFVKSYTMATGQNTGDKTSMGDKKTPEGIYHFINFHPETFLLDKYGNEGKIYGAGAFVMNYPNAVDRMMGKTGGGIWLHSTDDDSRVSKGLDSRGCVVLTDTDIRDISQYIEIANTPIIVVQDLVFNTHQTWERNRTSIDSAIKTWHKAWVNEDLENYISFYHPTKFRDDSKGGFSSYKSYKKAVFSNPGKPEIELDSFSILRHDNYAIVQFKQKYVSNTINDTGKKTLFLILDDNYNWKIIQETWNKIPEDQINRVAFEPSLRFFSTERKVATKKDNSVSNDI